MANKARAPNHDAILSQVGTLFGYNNHESGACITCTTPVRTYCPCCLKNMCYDWMDCAKHVCTPAKRFWWSHGKMVESYYMSGRIRKQDGSVDGG